MRRLHLLELEDQPWFPAQLRDYMTDVLHQHIELFRPYDPVVPLLADALGRVGADEVLDLCSGGGGPAAHLQAQLARHGRPVRFHLSDLYPNLEAFARATARSGGGVRFVDRPIDATAAPAEHRFRTMFTALHHFPPALVGRVLEDAAHKRVGIGIFDFTERTLRALLAMAFAPALAALTTPFLRPRRWSRFALTYVVPAVPLGYLFDGTVSMLRAYTADELAEIAAEVRVPGYRFQTGRLDHAVLPTSVTYILGLPEP